LSNHAEKQVLDFLECAEVANMTEADGHIIKRLRDIMTYTHSTFNTKEETSPPAGLSPLHVWTEYTSILEELSNQRTLETGRSELRIKASSFRLFHIHLLACLAESLGFISRDEEMSRLWAILTDPQSEEMVIRSFSHLGPSFLHHGKNFDVRCRLNDVIEAYSGKGTYDDNVRLFRWAVLTRPEGRRTKEYYALKQLVEVRDEVAYSTSPPGFEGSLRYYLERLQNLLRGNAEELKARKNHIAYASKNLRPFIA
jgi:hypothetical protein